MNAPEYIKPDFPEDAFVGTATYYAQYRVPYPKVLMDDLIQRTGISGQGRLLDLACGPGRIALVLASSFREVWALDLEPEMIEVGQEQAEQRGVTNIKWFVGKAEELEVEPASFELITIGEAFHRLDQRSVSRQALEWLAPGCCLITMGCYGITNGNEPWQRTVANIVRKWVARSSSDDASSRRPKPGSGPDHDEQVFRDAGFEDVASYSFVERQDWTVESIIGNLYSTSRCSKTILGDNSGRFENDLKDALLGYNASGRYRENLRCGYTLGRKPR